MLYSTHMLHDQNNGVMQTYKNLTLSAVHKYSRFILKKYSLLKYMLWRHDVDHFNVSSEMSVIRPHSSLYWLHLSNVLSYVCVFMCVFNQCAAL